MFYKRQKIILNFLSLLNIVEVELEEDYEKVTSALKKKFGDQVFLERL